MIEYIDDEIDWNRVGCLTILSEEFTNTGDELIDRIGKELKLFYQILRLKQKLSEGDICENTYMEKLLELNDTPLLYKKKD